MLNNLTGLRFYAAFWVFLYHFFPVYTTLPKVGYFEIGYLGVDLFFILSGFILTYVYYDKFFVNKVSARDYYNFLVKRFAKIYPLHFIITMVFIPLLCIAKSLFHQNSLVVDFDALLQNFLLIHSWATTFRLSWNFPSWSISAEWFAYLFLFAPLAIIFRTRKLFFYTISSILVIGFVANWLGIPNFTMDRYTMNGLPRIVPEFTLGVLAGLFRMKIGLTKSFSTLLFFTSLLMLISLFYFHFYFQQLCILGFAGIILALSYPTFFDFLFSSKTLIYLGNISYAFYLTQFLSLIIYEQIFKLLFSSHSGLPHLYLYQFTMAFCINFIFAALAYRYIEEPSRLILIKKLIKR